MNDLLLVASCLLNGTKSIFAKKSNTYLTEKHNIYTYNFYMFVIAFLIMLFIIIYIAYFVKNIFVEKTKKIIN